MDRTVDIYLVTETIAYDSIGQPIPTKTERNVFAQLRSITRAEWFEAGRNGLRPDISFVMNALDYDGEKVIKWNNNYYGIYRTFLARNNMIELYCEKKGGLVNGS